MSKAKDPDSWKYGGIKRRDYRHTAVDDGAFRPYAKKKKKKNTKKWCKGVVGREHVLKRSEAPWYWQVWTRGGEWNGHVCKTCGKQWLKPPR